MEVTMSAIEAVTPKAPVSNAAQVTVAKKQSEQAEVIAAAVLAPVAAQAARVPEQTGQQVDLAV